MPTSISRWNVRATTPLDVEIAAPFAKRRELMSSMASSSDD
jgi:hypothetical protein